MPEIVVVNTSPLFYLHKLGLLEVLNELYDEIIVPEAVKEELEKGYVEGQDVPNVDNFPWIQLAGVTVPKYLDLIVDLGPGEAEVLAVATHYPSALVILDDKLARRIAEIQGFRLTGPAGILLRAKERGFILTLRPVIETLLSLGFRLKPDLVESILELAGE